MAFRKIAIPIFSVAVPRPDWESPGNCSTLSVKWRRGNTARRKAAFGESSMVTETISSEARDLLTSIGLGGRKALRTVLTASVTRALIGAPTAHHLHIIPQDLRTADPSFASELYDGYFGLAGTVALTGSESPFTILPPSPLWHRELYAFGWLHNLEAAQDEIAR
jgi:hypothetical protein